MITGIFNQNNSNVTDQHEAKLIWSSVIISEKVHIGSPLISFLDSENMVNLLPLDNKMVLYSKMLPTWYKELTEDVIKKFYEMFKQTLRWKHKNKRETLLYLEGKSVIASFEKDFLRACYTVLNKFGLMQVKTMVSIENENIIIPYSNNVYNPDSFNPRAMVDNIADTMRHPEQFNFLDDWFFSRSKNKDIEEAVTEDFTGDEIIRFYHTDFLKLPPLESLLVNEVTSIRSQVLPMLKPVSSGLSSLKKELINKEFCFDTMNFIKQTLKELGIIGNDDLQKRVDSNVYVDRIISNNTDIPENLISICFCSYGELSEIHKDLNIIKDETTLYLKEELSKEINLNSTCIFLTLNQIKH